MISNVLVFQQNFLLAHVCYDAWPVFWIPIDDSRSVDQDRKIRDTDSNFCYSIVDNELDGSLEWAF